MKADVRCMPYISASMGDCYTEKWLSWNPGAWFMFSPYLSVYMPILVLGIIEMTLACQARTHTSHPLILVLPSSCRCSAEQSESILTRGIVILLSTAETRGTFGGEEHLSSHFCNPNLGKWNSLQNGALGSEVHSFLTVAGGRLFPCTIVNCWKLRSHVFL